MDQDPKMQGKNQITPDVNPASMPEASSATSTVSNVTEQAHTAHNAAQSNLANPSNIPEWMAHAPSNTDLPAGSVVEPATPPRKKHTGLIVTLIIIILMLIAGAAAAIWYFVCYSNPEQVAFDAISGFMQEKNISTAGGTIVSIPLDDGTYTKILVNLKNNANVAVAGSSEVEFTMFHALDSEDTIAENEDETIRLSLGQVYMSDGIIYLHIGGLMDAIDLAMAESAADGADLESLSGISESVYQFLEEIDGEWWQISIPDLIDELLGNFTDTHPAKDLYTCVRTSINTDTSTELASIYSANRFIIVNNVGDSITYNASTISSQGGTKFYQVSLDYNILADFINSLPNSHLANQIYSCVNTYLKDANVDTSPLTAESLPTVNPQDLEETIQFNSNTYLEISTFGHQLRGIYAYGDNLEDGSSYNANFGFTYEPVTIAAPSSYRPVTELLNHIKTLILSTIGGSLDEDLIYDPESGEFIYVGEEDIDWDDLDEYDQQLEDDYIVTGGEI